MALQRDTCPAQPNASQPVEVSQVVAYLLDEFHLLTYEVILQDVTEVGICTGTTRV